MTPPTKTLVLALLTISILDIPHDPKHVLVEACSSTHCETIRVPRTSLENQRAMDELANFLEQRLF